MNDALKAMLTAAGIIAAGAAVLFAFAMFLAYLSSVDETGWSAIVAAVTGSALFCVWFYRVHRIEVVTE